MKICAYCGQENNEISLHCGGCGTRLPLAKPPPAPEPPPTTRLPPTTLLDLATVEGAFEFSEGFSRPNWPRITQAIRERLSPEESAAAWTEAVEQWLDLLRQELGAGYGVHRSDHFLLLMEGGPEAAQPPLQFAERTRDLLRETLGRVAWRTPPPKHVLLLFSEADDYYQYISAFFREGTHPAASGCCVSAGYPHMALIHTSPLWSCQVIAHELVHDALAHLRGPRWLHEGLALRLERLAGSARQSLLPGDSTDRHRQYWNAERIQSFWSGASFFEPGDAVELSYDLAAVLIHLLLEDREKFLAFVEAARPEDGGQDAALEMLGTCLGQVAGTFLGPGDWRPRRKAIQELWAAYAKT